MPLTDLDGAGMNDWLSAQQTVKDGVRFKLSGKRMFNTLPNQSETEIFHLRPHTNLSAYYLPSLDNYTRGDRAAKIEEQKRLEAEKAEKARQLKAEKEAEKLAKKNK